MNRPYMAWSSAAVRAWAALSLLAALSSTTPAAARPGNDCGGLTGAGCAKGEYCAFSEEAQCGAADQTGICVVRPQACTLDYNPVCGCDDTTYPNACAANAAGVSVADKGKCPNEGDSCTADEDCPHGSCERGPSCQAVGCERAGACTECGDGSTLTCKSLPQACPAGQVREIVDGCYGACVDRRTCEPAKAKTCKYEGKVYYENENFPAKDGCNRCTCDGSGKVQCTLKLCTPKCDYTAPNRTWVAKDPERCQVVRFSCAANTRYFANECGCGCEAIPTPPKPTACRVGGCSGQLCTDASLGGVASTCEWRSEYACYRGATCAVQANGRCGWTLTPELRMCLGGAGAGPQRGLE